MARNITVIPARENLSRGHQDQNIVRLRTGAYARVSTDREEQQSSYRNQVDYYTEYITSNPRYIFAGIYADEGISATSTKKRTDFNRMIADCRAGKLDLIITKSISRFARNTLDCLKYVRELRALGIGIFFEKENINTLEPNGEVLLTILSSLAQDESRTISENSAWGIRRRFETGTHKMSTKRFMGLDMGSDGRLRINPEQAPTVERLYTEFLDGKTVDYIKRVYEREGVKNWNGIAKWESSTLESMLENEKYKGDTILQKSYTVDFLTKKRAINKGELEKYYVEGSHDAIIEPWIWECVQLEKKRRKAYMLEHGLAVYSRNVENNPFASKIICGTCNKAFTRKGWQGKERIRRVWLCSERYKVKGVMGCSNRHVDEETLEKAYIIAWNMLLENRDNLLEKWKQQESGDDLLARYRAMKFQEITEGAVHIKHMDIDFMLKTLDHMKVFESGNIKVVFLDRTAIDMKTSK